MKNITIFALLAILAISSNAQTSFNGIWQGNYVSQKLNFLFVLRLSETEGKLKGSMDIPQQMLLDYKSIKLSSEKDSFFMEIPAFRATYKSVRVGDSLIGIWYQSDIETVLNLGLTPEDKAFRMLRPQTPQPPYSYICKDVTFLNKKAKINLAGTLTLPDTVGKWPVVVLVSGSGAQDRNEELLQHKPFLVIADYFTRNGIAVLRFDDRGVGKSEGKFNTATTYDFNTDVTAAVAYLSKLTYIDKTAMGVVGHSEGGIICMMQAAQNKSLRFVISMAGVAIPCSQLLVMQQDKMLEGYGSSEDARETMWNFNSQFFELVQSTTTTEDLRTKALELLNETKTDLTEAQQQEYGLNEAYVNALVSQASTPWFRAFTKMVPANFIQKARCNFLAINGSNDTQVPAEANIEAFKTYAPSKPGLLMDSYIFSGLNHLFQPSKTGLPAEYAMIETTIDPVAMQYMVDWIKKVLATEK